VSKVLLEKAASRFAEEHGISVVTLCPVITVGAAPARKVRTSVIDVLSLLSGEWSRVPLLSSGAASSVPTLVDTSTVES
jgi:anthocyanidin reductase